jgi:hypothetical protein
MPDPSVAELSSEPRDVHVDGSLVDYDFFAPDGIKEVLTAEHAPRLHCQRDEQAEFFRTELKLSISDYGAAAFWLDVKRTSIQNRRRTSRWNRPSPYRSTYSRE